MEKIKKYIPSIITFLYGLIMTIIRSPFTGDANAFLGLNGNIISELINRYHLWTSRVVIEGVLLVVLRSYKGILWIILNILIIVLLYFALRKIFNNKKEIYLNYVIASIIMLYAYNDMVSAGWSVTTINYLWPLVLGVFSFIPIISILNNENKSKKILFLTIPALIYAVNQEQTAALIFGFSLIFLIYYYIKNKKINYTIFLYTVIALIGIIFALTCPGNANRLNSETITWFNDYNKLGLLDKTLLSLNNTFDILLSNINWIVIASYGTLTYYYIKNKNKLYILSIILLLGTIIIPHLNIFNLNHLYVSNYKEGINIIPVLRLDSINYLLSIIISIIYFIITIFLLYRVKDKNNKLLCPIIYIAAILSRIIIGFSPTLFVSGYRTGIFLNFLLAMIMLILFNSMKLSNKEKKYIVLISMALVALKFIILYIK